MFESAGTIGTIIANSALELNKSFDLKNSILNMQDNSLTLQAGANILNGYIVNTSDPIGKGNPVIQSTTFEGNINIKGRVLIGANVTMNGTVTVVDTIYYDGY